ncbi:MAG: leucine-rich repeat protein [Treponema sp.]|nr:leucine-rich repeat protein [Treponema sp.]
MKNQLKTYLFVLFVIFSMTFTFFSCKAEVEEPEPQPTYYTVTYVSEHGTAPEAISVLENAVLTEGELAALSDGTLVFKGWYDGDVKAVAGEYQVTRNVTLTAHWAATATVSYQSVFGTVPESFDVELNQTLTAENLADITCSPYTFQGWFYSKDENNNGTGTQAQADDPITADTPLYAKWQTATVSYTTQYGSAPSITKFTGARIESSDIPSLANTGYTFNGWFNGSTQLTTNYTVMSNVTFTARWTANTYTITFKANGGAGADYTQTVTYGTSTKLNVNAFSYPGYALLQWNEEADGSGTSYSDGADFVVQATDITLYAQWDPIADNTTIIDMIRASTETRTIAAKGEFSNTLMAELKQVLHEENYNVTLDFSHVTGLTSLEKYAFEYCWIDEIILPETITAIPSSAFSSGRLKKIRIPESVTSIGSYAFCDCSYLTSITIPDSVTSIGPIAFQNCKNLKSIIIPDSITTIPNQAFYWCENLESVTIPNSVTTIGKDAFGNCKKLRSITIPESVVFFGNDCFEDSPITQMVFADTESKWYSKINGNTYIGKMNNPSKNGTLIKEYTHGYSVFSEKYSQ